MSISNECLETRFTAALLDYVAASGRVRRAELEFRAETTASGAARAAAKWRSAKGELRRAGVHLRYIEASFDANNGKVEAIAARLEAARPQVPSRAA
jgi:hypothetical protein